MFRFSNDYFKNATILHFQAEKRRMALLCLLCCRAGVFCYVLTAELLSVLLSFCSNDFSSSQSHWKKKHNAVWVSTHLQHAACELSLLKSFFSLFLEASWIGSTWNFFEQQCTVCATPPRASLGQHLLTLPHLQRPNLTLSAHAENGPARAHQWRACGWLLSQAHPWLPELVSMATETMDQQQSSRRQVASKTPSALSELELETDKTERNRRSEDKVLGSSEAIVHHLIRITGTIQDFLSEIILTSSPYKPYSNDLNIALICSWLSFHDI